MSNSNWKVVLVSFPAMILPSWAITNGFAVAYCVPIGIHFEGCSDKSDGWMIPVRYSGYCLERHALTQCNTLNLNKVTKHDDRLGEMLVVNSQFTTNVH